MSEWLADWAVWWALGVAAATFLLPFVMLFIVPRGRKPSSAIAWLLVIAIFAWFGLVAFLILGHPRLPRQRRRRQMEMERRMREDVERAMADPDAAPWISPDLDARALGAAELAQSLGALPPFSGNDVQVLGDYDQTIHCIGQDIDAAQRYVHVQFYILAGDAVSRLVIDALLRAKARGVTVRVLMDHIGSRKFAAHEPVALHLRRAGIQVQDMLPFRPWQGHFARPDLRNHRKIVVIDGDVGYVGSQNLIRSSYWKKGRQYLDIMARSRGPIVQQLDAVFRMDWYAETGDHLDDRPLPQSHAGDMTAQILPSGPGHRSEENLRVFNHLLYAAKHRIVVVNAYFVPDETLMMALTSAAQRGVHVDFITPEKGDQVVLSHAQRSFYGELLAAGVNIHLHPRPWNLHTKTITIDDDIAVIGSSNLDIRSFELNLEVSMICYSSQVVEQLRTWEQRYLEQCRPLTLEAWRRLPPWSHMADSLARLTSSVQ